MSLPGTLDCGTASTSAYSDRTQPVRKVCRLDDLPTEILEKVMEFSPGLSAIYKFVQASGRAQALFARRPYGMMISALRCSSMHEDLKQIYGKVFSIRHIQRFRVLACLKNQFMIIMPDLEPASILKPIEMLKDALNISKSIFHAERSFFKVQLPKLAAKIEEKIAGDHFNRHALKRLSIKIRAAQESSTELYRIRRALWRLRLYFEAFYEPYLYSLPYMSEQENIYSPQPKALLSQGPLISFASARCVGKFQYTKSQERFFSPLTAWELEEMECVWYHLRRQNITLWHRPCPYCYTACLPDDLLRHLSCHCQENRNLGAEYGYDFEQACSWFHLDLERSARKAAQCLESPAREPGAGYEFFMGRVERIYHVRLPYGIRRTLGMLQEWGYCIWDRERLEAWRLIDSEDAKVRESYLELVGS